MGSIGRKHATCSCAVSSCLVTIPVVVFFAAMPEGFGYVDGAAPAGFALGVAPAKVASSQALELSAQAGTQALGSTVRGRGARNRVVNRRLSHDSIRVRAMDGTVLTTISATLAARPPELVHAKIASKLDVRPEVVRVSHTSPSEVTVVFDVTRLAEAIRFDHERGVHEVGCDMCCLPLEYDGNSFYTMREADVGCSGWQPSRQDRATHSPGMLGLLSAINDVGLIYWPRGTCLCSACWLSKAHIMQRLPDGRLGDAIADEVGTFVGAQKGGRRHRWCDLLRVAFSDCDEREAEELALSHPDRLECRLQSKKEAQQRWEGHVHRHAPHLLREIGGGAR